MDQIEFIFQVSTLDKETLLPQISQALKKRVEIHSRQLMPKMWKQTDQMNEKVSEEEQKKRQLRNKITGIILIVLGLALLIPGMFNQKKITALIIAGTIAVVVGLFKVRSGVKPPKQEKFDSAAEEFLNGQAESIAEESVQVCFSDEEMITVMGDLEDLDQDAVTFDQIEFVMETRDMFFVVYQGRGVVLQKKDLDQEMGTLDEFREFINENVKQIIDLTEEA